MARDPKGDAQRERLLALLDAAMERPEPIRFWWRDDDAETVTPALNRLLELAGRHDLPIALAVIPKRATSELAARVADEPRVAVLQHGWSHRDHAPEGEKSMELGDHRPLEVVLGDLRQGFERLGTLVPEKFKPVLVPPWNRISNSVRGARETVGLVGLSTFGPASPDDPQLVNAHVDIFEWRPARRPLTRAELFSRLASEIERRLRVAASEPLGLMTHHLVHDEANWDSMEEVFELTGRHPAVTWLPVDSLLDL